MNKAWVISVNMGYGHQRTAFPLKYLTPTGEIINANDYAGIPAKDRQIWEITRHGYEFVSDFKRTPLIGDLAFSFFDRFQKIFSFYPKRDLSKPNYQLKQVFSFIKKGWGRDLIEKLKNQNSKLKTNLPLISTFFTPAFMAEFFEYPGEIFCVICDADISRTWVSLNPRESKIKYFVPTSWAASRLKLYGIKEENIFLTGYPLPLDIIGDENLAILKNDLKNRLLNLDPQKQYFKQYQDLIDGRLGRLPEKSNHPLTLMFAVGGSGVQKEIAIKIVKSLAVKVWAEEIKVILVAGTKEKIKNYFEQKLAKLKLKNSSNVEIIFEKNIESYFQKFNLALRTTDILWTKPSELSFYTALGLPIIIAPTIGSQEDFNKKWLLRVGSGIPQESPTFTQQWLFDYLESGRFAEAAMQGFVETEKLGALKIKNIIEKCSG